MIAKPYRLALTLGEPAGIGPDILLQLIQQPLPVHIVAIGSAELLTARAALLTLPFQYEEFDPHARIVPNEKSKLTLVPIPLAAPCIPGQLNVLNSHYVIQTLKKAYELCNTNQCQALVTAPIHKAIINQSGIAFSGHTEFLAALAGVSSVLMTLYSPKIIMALVTTHCAVNDISNNITALRVSSAIELLHQGLQQLFQYSRPKIGICGLNPHAGESGLLGTEEQTVIIPTIQALQQKGYDLIGPLAADTAFTPKSLSDLDAILAMYHDQGLGPMKALFFGELVNITLGLPFLRSSVDHGTALPIAGTGKADPSSLYKAILTTAQLLARR